MNVIMIYDQIQAGLGTKYDGMLPFGAMRGAIGPSIMMAPYLKQEDLEVMACLYCGSGLFLDDPDEVSRKMCAMVSRQKPDVVMCGPALDFPDYAKMCARIACDIVNTTTIPAIAAMAEINEDVISTYKDRIHIVRTPKKGDVGLTASLKNMCRLAGGLARGKSVEDIVKEVCFD